MINNQIITNKPILIFPGGMPRSLEYLQKCLRDGQAVIGASSLDYDVAQEQYPAWIHLPFVTQAEFNESLAQAILQFNIGGVFSPNPVIWDHLNRTLQDIAPGTPLVNESPVNTELSGYRTAQHHARAVFNQPLPIASNTSAQPSLSLIELSALFRHAALIPGMCDHEKFCVLCEIARHSPRGDVVEIGSWWGKSAFILARLSQGYNIGHLLCVDPWSNEHLVQNDASSMVDRVSAQVDAAEALEIFKINLIPYNHNNINYLQLPSTEAAKHYSQQTSVDTPAFGITDYCGHIAILHIDGNHNYAAAKADILSWSDYVVKGGWIIVDDYIWPYGDGPQRAGDEFLTDNQSSIDVAFVMGSALFIKIKNE